MKSKLRNDKLKKCLNKKIKELLSEKNENKKKIINELQNEKNFEKFQNLNEILNMKLYDFIYINYDYLNKEYTKYFKIFCNFENGILFKNLNSIEKLINDIISTKGNKKKD